MSKNLCIFCYKTIPVNSSYLETIEDEKNSGVVVKSFIKLVGRYLGNTEESKLENKLFSCCEDFEIITGSFCELYHQLKCLEIQLEWKLRTLVNVMKLANRVPSRLKQLKCVFEQDAVEDQENNLGNVNNYHVGEDVASEQQQKLKSFKSFRSHLIKKCVHKLSKSQPRVFLGQGNNNSFGDGSAISSNSTTERKPILPLLESFLGWIMSFSAVTLLLVTTTNNHTNNVSRGPGICDEYDALSNLVPVEVCLDDASLLEAECTDNHEECENERNDDLLSIESLDNLRTTVIPKTEDSMDTYENSISSHSQLSNDPFENELPDDDFIFADDKQPKYEIFADPETEQFSEQTENALEIKPEAPGIIQEKRQIKSGLKSSTKRLKSAKRHARRKVVKNLEENKMYSCKVCNIFCKTYNAHRVHKTTISHQIKVKLSLPKSNQTVQKSYPAQNENPSSISIGDCDLGAATMAMESNQLQESDKRYNFRENRKRSYYQEETELEVKDEESDYSDESISADDEDAYSSSASDASVEYENQKEGQVRKKQPENDCFYRCTSTKHLKEHQKLHCEICNLRIRKNGQAIHFKEYHDFDGMEAEKIVRCEVENCSAYFKTTSQRYIHVCNVHQSKVPDKIPDTNVRAENFKCNFCDVVQEDPSDLAVHEVEHAIREEHSKKMKFNCARCPYNSVLKKRYITHHLEKHLKLSAGTIMTCPICCAKKSEQKSSINSISKVSTILRVWIPTKFKDATNAKPIL